jgi:hypothetical protein
MLNIELRVFNTRKRKRGSQKVNPFVFDFRTHQRRKCLDNV